MKVDFPRAVVGLLLVVGCSYQKLDPLTPGDGAPGGEGGPGGVDGNTGGHMVDGAPIDVPGHLPGNPGIGSHGLAYLGVGESFGTTSIAISPMTIQASGSTMVVGVARGNQLMFTTANIPTDNKGNSAYQKQSNTLLYPGADSGSGTAVYALPSARGGADFQVVIPRGKATNNNADEITMFAVEVTDGAQILPVVSDTKTSSPISLSIQTSGPAALIAFWWGDNGTLNSITADSGFVVLDQQLLASNDIQGAVAVKNVSDAGTYSVTWTSDPAQPALLWLVAVQ